MSVTQLLPTGRNMHSRLPDIYYYLHKTSMKLQLESTVDLSSYFILGPHPLQMLAKQVLDYDCSNLPNNS